MNCPHNSIIIKLCAGHTVHYTIHARRTCLSDLYVICENRLDMINFMTSDHKAHPEHNIVFALILYIDNLTAGLNRTVYNLARL